MTDVWNRENPTSECSAAALITDRHSFACCVFASAIDMLAKRLLGLLLARKGRC